MKRLVWAAVGAVAASVGAYRLGLLRQDGLRGQAVTGAVDTAKAAVTVAKGAGKATRGLARARRDLVEAMAEREAQLRHDLLQDADVEGYRAARAAGRGPRVRDGHASDDWELWDEGVTPPGWRRDEGGRWAARRSRSRKAWADAPTEDPEDDGDLPYSFF